MEASREPCAEAYSICEQRHGEINTLKSVRNVLKVMGHRVGMEELRLKMTQVLPHYRVGTIVGISEVQAILEAVIQRESTVRGEQEEAYEYLNKTGSTTTTSLQDIAADYGLCLDVREALTEAGLDPSSSTMSQKDFSQLFSSFAQPEETQSLQNRKWMAKPHVASKYSNSVDKREKSPMAIAARTRKLEDMQGVLNGIGRREVVSVSKPQSEEEPNHQLAIRLGATQVWRRHDPLTQCQARSVMLANGHFPPGAPRGHLHGVTHYNPDYHAWQLKTSTRHPLDGLSLNFPNPFPRPSIRPNYSFLEAQPTPKREKAPLPLVSNLYTVKSPFLAALR